MGQTGGQSYSDTSPYKVSDSSLASLSNKIERILGSLGGLGEKVHVRRNRIASRMLRADCPFQNVGVFTDDDVKDGATVRTSRQKRL